LQVVSSFLHGKISLTRNIFKNILNPQIILDNFNDSHADVIKIPIKCLRNSHPDLIFPETHLLYSFNQEQFRGKHQAFIQAGAGIVADSIPEHEYEETCNKAQAMMKAIELAEQGLE
jgi:hypothetical protein